MFNFDLMECGCVAQVTRTYDGARGCFVHSCFNKATSVPNLSNRQAYCSSCKTAKPSCLDLPFFVYQGEGTAGAQNICKKCSRHQAAHTLEAVNRNSYSNCVLFEPRGGLEYDSFYCGCEGWN